MKLHLVLEVEPRGETLGYLTAFLLRMKSCPAPPTVRDLAALLLVLKPSLTSARLAGTPPAGRDHWIRTPVEVPWSAVPGSLYTCTACGVERQSIPPAAAGGRWRTEYRLAGGVSTERPACRPHHLAQNRSAEQLNEGRR